MYAVQTGVKIDAKSKESSKFLSALLDNLDDMKKALKDDERISSELHGQAYIEEYALKLFAFAFKRDEAADFGPCLDSGEVPVAGPASEEDASSLPDLSSLAKLTPEVKPTPPSNPPSSKEPSSGSPGKAGSSHAASPQETAKGGKELDPKISALAIKHAKYAISALDYDDRTTAIQNLQEALKYLTTQ
ncbi:unnamed protein product [Schistocephalus solidus]|uniref:Vta1 domain-containing protein n=1 Tax=Schistocephalus solidus TaxID=70667 RepID=A0A183SH83_SCHSO|nr:unnamed protein product [Schistocephalus solidus]